MPKYAKDNPAFAAAIEAPDSVNFRPRTHLFYTEREAEQDAYYWFLKGVESELGKNNSAMKELHAMIDRLSEQLNERLAKGRV